MAANNKDETATLVMVSDEAASAAAGNDKTSPQEPAVDVVAVKPAASSDVSMGCVDNSLMALMPISNAVSIGLVVWVCVGTSDGTPEILTIAGGLAAFYMLWALRNYLSGHSKEKGMFTMGCVVLGQVLDGTVDCALGHWVAVVGASTVVLSFAMVCFVFPFTKLCGGKPLEVLATRSGKSLTWAKVLKVYMFVSLLTWSLILGLLIAADIDHCGSAGGADGPGGGAPCTFGAQCGGQIYSECGSHCPNICGQPPAQACIMLCAVGWQCPASQYWNGGVNGTTASCVNQAECP
jgi:hypothetical protein